MKKALIPIFLFTVVGLAIYYWQHAVIQSDSVYFDLIYKSINLGVFGLVLYYGLRNFLPKMLKNRLQERGKAIFEEEINKRKENQALAQAKARQANLQTAFAHDQEVAHKVFLKEREEALAKAEAKAASLLAVQKQNEKKAEQDMQAKARRVFVDKLFLRVKTEVPKGLRVVEQSTLESFLKNI